MDNKIIRTICYFTTEPSQETISRINEVCHLLEAHDFVIQTKRICSAGLNGKDLEEKIDNEEIRLCLGSLDPSDLPRQMTDFFFKQEAVPEFGLDQK